MAHTSSRLPMKSHQTAPAPRGAESVRHPIESMRREFDRLFDDLTHNLWFGDLPSLAAVRSPLWRNDGDWQKMPAVDIVEKDTAYEITADLPGLEEKDIDVSLSNGSLVIHGEKYEESREDQADHYVHERHFGSFERRFAVPDNVDVDQITAGYRNGVLSVTLPKRPDAQKPAKRIEVKSR